MDFLEKINKLPANVREYICSNDVRLSLERACFLYGISEEQMEKLALPIRDIFTKDVSLVQLPVIIGEKLFVQKDISLGIAYELNAKMFNLFREYFTDASGLLEQWRIEKSPAIISEEEARRLILEIEPWILEDNDRLNENSKKKNETVGLEIAVRKYPNINEQLITSIPLVLRISPDPVRPTVKNWIADYHEQMGLGKHGTFDRGNYLFHGENSKRLAPEDRRKLSAVLKSLDEGTPLTIDPEKQQIIFEEKQVAGNAPQTVNPMQNMAENKQATINKIQDSRNIGQQAISDRREAAYKMPEMNRKENLQSENIAHRAEADKRFLKQGIPQATDDQKYAAESIQPKTINLRQDIEATQSMRPAVRPMMTPTMSMRQQQAVSMNKAPERSVPQPPHNLPQETGARVAQRFSAQSIAPQHVPKPQQIFSAAPVKREFENKSPNFSDLLKAQQTNDGGASVVNRVQDDKQAGSVASSSSPQRVTVEKKPIVKRSPYRITPHNTGA